MSLILALAALTTPVISCPGGSIASFRFDAMLAVVPIARDGDGNCCPRGGQALFDLSILGDRLVVDGMRFQPMQPAGAEVEQVIVRSKPPRQ